jgi:hypothetical protein
VIDACAVSLRLAAATLSRDHSAEDRSPSRGRKHEKMRSAHRRSSTPPRCLKGSSEQIMNIGNFGASPPPSPTSVTQPERLSRRVLSPREAGEGRRDQRQYAASTLVSRARQGRLPPERILGSPRPLIQQKMATASATNLIVRFVGTKRGRHKARAIRKSRICATCVRSLPARRRKMAYQAMI